MTRRRAKPEPTARTDRWLVSYADFITLLFAFFVVMYALSSVHEEKYRQLSQALDAAFDGPPKRLEPIAIGDPERSPVIRPLNGTGDLSSALQSDQITSSHEAGMAQDIAALARNIEQEMAVLMQQGIVEVHRNSHWLEVVLDSDVLFAPGIADLETESLPIVRRLGKTLAPLANQIQVEGYTDNTPIFSEYFPSNWELSSGRSASVVHELLSSGVKGGRLSALGYAEYRPFATNRTEQGRALNRRVVVVIFSVQQDYRLMQQKRSKGDKP